MSGSENRTVRKTRPARPKRKGRRLLWALCIMLGLIILALGMSWWTMVRMPGASHRGPLPAADERLTALAGELRRDVAQLAGAIGERNVLNRPHELAQAADWLEAELAAAGYEVNRQSYPVGGRTCSNLEAAAAGTTRPDEIVVIGAHYDSVIGTPGANDNASGVAALLALARRFSGRKAGRTVRFVAFANEEPPFFQTEMMGSRVYAQGCRRRGENVVAMLCLETIGYFSDAPGSQQYPPPLGLLYPSEGNFIGVIGNVKSRRLVRRVVGAFRRHEPFPCEGAAVPAAVPGVSFSDHWSFWQAGYPAVMVTDTAMFRYPHYHEAEDTIDQVDFERLARVVRGLEAAIAVLAGADEDEPHR
jgi:hypothetical protein